MQGNQGLGLVYIHVLGCRSSLCEGEYIAGSLKSRGALITEELGENINAAVIVTCSVTQEADRKCRQIVRRARKILGREKILAVCGCWSQALDSESAMELGINILAGSRGKNILPEIIESAITNHDTRFQDLRTQNIFSSALSWEELEISSPVMHSRAFIKIQDGCDHFCSYCIIPFLRGHPVSRPEKNILDEIHRLIDNETQEIIFTGIHLGLYGRDIDSSLAKLINSVSKIQGLKRLRLGSLEPFSLDERLLAALSECESFCHHLHLPLQSGDNNILALMRRGYTAEEFIRVCDDARKFLGDDLHISSDILTGFPTESDSAFNNTLNVMRESKLGRVHVFPFSERKGTLAEKMRGKISHQEKILRVSMAITLGRELYQDYVKRFINHDVEILIEESGSKGHTKHFVEADILDKKFSPNQIIIAKAVSELNGRLKCIYLNRN
ncbi:MAG: MiaB/RimO family radical SAM methylthiotransferase [Synergistaceae bacterium]|nr:MiaB/RimO family radical SAM methylthiotransferase [Synergistaceae bacterium]